MIIILSSRQYQLFYYCINKNIINLLLEQILTKCLESLTTFLSIHWRHTSQSSTSPNLLLIYFPNHLPLNPTSVRIAFIGNKAIIDAQITLKTIHFTVNGNPASRTQFPLQNCFALTVHKSQGLTLPQISVFLDSQFFAPGQAYVALSRAPSWGAVEIPILKKEAFSVNRSVVEEYDRLELVAETTPFTLSS